MPISKPSKPQVVYEAILAPFSRVDRKTRTIYGVKVLGQDSLWGRYYLDEAIERDFQAYEGVSVFMGELGGIKVGPGGMSLALRHQRYTKKPKTPLAGKLRNVRRERTREGLGVFANLVAEPGAAGDLLLEAADTCPTTFGLSHVAAVKSTRMPLLGGGLREVVGGIGPVHYVEVVSNPASTKHLFEGLDMADMATDPGNGVVAQMSVEDAFHCLEMAIVHEYEGADRISALKIVDKFKAQLLGGDEGDTGGSADETATAPEGKTTEGTVPIGAIRPRGMTQELRETNTLLRQLIEAQAGGGRRLSPVRSGARAPVQEGAPDPKPKAPEKIPYEDKTAMRRFLES